LTDWINTSSALSVSKTGNGLSGERLW
jgi:hypothetical protein